MKRKILAILGGILMLSGVMAAPVMAASCADSQPILGMRPWFYGLTKDDIGANGEPTCVVDSDNFKGKDNNGNDKLPKAIWTIVLNVTVDISVAVGILAVGFIIYGGYMYIISEGDAGRAAKGKKTLMSAIIGLIISVLATIIVNFIITVLTKGGGIGNMLEMKPDELIQSGLETAYAVAGTVAVGFIIYAGVNYATAAGDPGKIAKAHKTIIYALIGLVIVVLAAIITNFVFSAVGGAI